MSTYWDTENEQISFGWEIPEVVTLGVAAPTATTLAGFAGLTVSGLAGQILRVLTGNQKGYTYWIIDNTATVLTLQGAHTPNEGGAAIVDGDRVAYSTNGILATTRNKWIGIFKGGQLPELEADIAEHPKLGQRIRYATSINKKDYKGGRIPVQLQSAEILLALGEVWSEGSVKAGGGSTTITAAVYAWDNQITVADATNLSTNDYIEIAGAIHKEVRKITNVNVLVLTLDKPLEYYHANGQAVVEVEAPLTVYVKMDSQRPLRSLSIIDVMSDPEGLESDVIRVYKGLYINQADFKGVTEKELITDLQLYGMDYAIDPATVTKPSVTPDTDDFFYWDDAEVEINSVLIAIPKDATVTWANNLNILRALNGSKSKKPYRIETHNVKGKTIIHHHPVNKTILTSLESPSELDARIKFARSATDYIEFTLDDGIATGKTPQAEQDRLLTEINRLEESIQIKILTGSKYFY